MASNPWIMWENILPDATTVTEQRAAVDGWPLTNAYDWRPGTAYRYALTGSLLAFNSYDFGAGVTKEPDTIIVGPYKTDGTRPVKHVRKSDNGIAWSNATQIGVFVGTGAGATFASTTWSGKGDHQYWGFQMDAGANRQVGIVALGRVFEIGVGGLPSSFEPFPDKVQAERVMSHSGYPLGANVNSIERTFTLDISNPGLSVSTFHEPASGLTWQDFLDHAQRDGKPFFFCWNPGSDYPSAGYQNSIFLCRLISAPTPIEWTTARRGLTMTFSAYNRVG
jgi:hypothetical protein